MQKSFCVSVMFTALVAANAAQMHAKCPMLAPFRQAGAHHFTVHGAFFDLVVKKALHEFVEEKLPHSLFFSIGGEEFDVQDIFKALSDALAEIADHHVMGVSDIDYNTVVRHACLGHMAHKVWVALCNIIGVSKYVSDEVKEQYNKYGKAWFSKAFAISLDSTYGRLRAAL